MSKILILPGDGIGKEIGAQAIKVIDSLNANHSLGMNLVHGLIGGSAYDETGSPLPDETLGDPDEGIAPGTAWEDIPEDWSCPDCGASKEDFEMVEI